MNIYTIGYERRSVGDLIGALKSAGVRQVLDVRQKPWSARPEFRGYAFCTALQEAGIIYRHMPAAGNPFRPRKGDVVDVNAILARFRMHIEARPLLLTEIYCGATQIPTALLCYERDATMCHRSVIVDCLKARYPAAEHVAL